MTQTETLELLVATLQQANSSQSESIERLTRQNEQLQNKLQELLAQVAWLNRQLFGRKSEKLAHLDPNQLSLFDPPVQPLEHEIPEEAAAQEPVCSTTPKKKVRQNRNMLDGLPVVEIVIEPEGVDPDKYKRIGEERTRTLIRKRDHTSQVWPERQYKFASGASGQCYYSPSSAIAYLQGTSRCQPAH